MAKRAAVAMLCFILLLSGCSGGADAGQTDKLFIYRLAAGHAEAGGRVLVSEAAAYDGSGDALHFVVEKLNSQPEQQELKSAFPDNVSIVGCIIEDGTAIVSMSPAYNRMDSFEKTLADFAVTCSLYALDNIISVDIMCDGELSSEDLKPERCILTDENEAGIESFVKVFLPDMEGRCLRCETFFKEAGGTDSDPEFAVKTVLSENENIPSGTVLRSLEINDGRCRIEISSGLFKDMPKDPWISLLNIYSIVDTLCFFDSIDNVVILVNGERVTSYGGLTLEWPMESDSRLIVFK